MIDEVFGEGLKAWFRENWQKARRKLKKKMKCEKWGSRQPRPLKFTTGPALDPTNSGAGVTIFTVDSGQLTTNCLGSRFQVGPTSPDFKFRIFELEL